MKRNIIIRKVLERDLTLFVKSFFKVLEPEGQYQHNWHIDVICQHLEAIEKDLIKNLNINIPPRTIKSVLVNVMYPCWLWTRDPSLKIISISHSHSLSMGFNQQRRKIIESDAYQYFWPIQLRDDMNTRQKFGNYHNGYFESVSVGSSFTGKQANRLISDDLLDATDAYSESKRTFANKWYSTTAYNRLQNKKTDKRINIMQRLHQNDLTGHLIENYKFEHLVIPMQKEKGQMQTCLNWKDPRKVGEFLHPARYAQEEKDDEYKGLGEYGWAGQMQQRPVPATGGIIKTSWIKEEKEINSNSLKPLVMSVDATFKGSKKSDYVVIQIWGKRGADFCIIDQLRGKWDFPKTLERIRSMHKKHSPTKTFIEDKANGPAIISILKKEISGVKPVVPRDSKEARVHAVSHFFECGNVIIDKDLPKKEEFIKELTMFPKAEHDDMVDAATQAINQLKTNNSLVFA